MSVPNPHPTIVLQLLTNAMAQLDDESNSLVDGYTTMAFSEEGPGEIGALDKFCGFERSYFTIAIALVYVPFGPLKPHPLISQQLHLHRNHHPHRLAHFRAAVHKEHQGRRAT